jgi:hypothetical protein
MRRWALRALAATGAAIAVLLAVAVNAATANLPGFLNHHPGRAWALVAVLGLFSVGCAVLAVRVGESSNQHGAADKVQAGGVHVGRDLIVDGAHNVVAGGDYSSQTTPGPSTAPGSVQPRRRRGR